MLLGPRDTAVNPSYPLYIVSKGRARLELGTTTRALNALAIPHYIVIEDQELKAYQVHKLPRAELLVLDKSYLDNYDTCDDLGTSKSKGPGAARNFVWDHAQALGAPWHWVMDDNIRRFYRMNNNFISPVQDGAIFKSMEDFSERFSNVAMTGPNYESLVIRRQKKAPYVLNTRIYSCNLIRTALPYRWRGRYNEDTDLSLRMLKDRWCTVLFNAFLQDKMATQKIGGGNTKEFYAQEGTIPKSLMQVNLHPDVSKFTWRYNRWHHVVNYKQFKHGLKKKPDLIISAGVNNYGMVYQEKVENTWQTLTP